MAVEEVAKAAAGGNPITGLAAIGISAGIGAVGSYLAGKEASKAAEDAAETAAQGQIDATRIATDTQLEMYYQSREDTAPWLQAGVNALGTLTGTTPTGTGGETRLRPQFRQAARTAEPHAGFDTAHQLKYRIGQRATVHVE